MRQEGALTFEGYVTGERWTTARLSSCPACEGPVRSHGTYPRKCPRPAKVARFYCAPCRLTISLLPDFYASRTPGLLEDIESAAAAAESAASVEVTDIVRRRVKAANVGKTGSCHLFRHAMATLMLEGGADVRMVQAMLGHASLNTTALYTHVAIRALKEVHERTHPGARLGKPEQKKSENVAAKVEAAELLAALEAEQAEEAERRRRRFRLRRRVSHGRTPQSPRKEWADRSG